MENQRAAGIAGIATKYGLVSGALSFVVFYLRVLAGMKQSWGASLIDAVLLVVLMVLAHREFKKAHGGMMTYGQGLGMGTWLSSTGAGITGILVYVYVEYLNAGYIAAAIEAQRAALEQHGISGAQARQAMAFTAAITTPVGIAVTSLIKGVIVGFVVALIVSTFTQKSDPGVVV